MGSIVLDSESIKRLQAVQAATRILDGEGHVVGTFHPPILISAEERAELEERRKDRSGRRLDEVIRELRNK